MRGALTALILVLAACGSSHDDEHMQEDPYRYGDSSYDEAGRNGRVNEAAVPVRMTIGEKVVCDGTHPAGIFRDVYELTGLDFIHQADHPSQPLASGVYAGVAVADFDGDAELDLYFTNIGGPPGYYLTEGRGSLQWQRKTLERDMSGQFAAYPGDADGDGDLDILFTPLYLHGGLLSNDGGGRLTSDMWLPGPESMMSTELTAAWFDADADGRLDIVMAGGPEHQGGSTAPNGAPERLLMWDNGYQTTILSAEPNGEAFAVAPADIDNDGDLDLYVVNDFGMMLQPNRLLLNDGVGAFIDVSSHSGADVAVWGMGVAVGDVNNDGWLDLYAATMSPEHDRLMINLGDGSFDDATFDWNASSIMVSSGVAWGPAFIDIENDGDLDLYVARGHHPGLMPDVDHNGALQPNVLLVNEGGRFEHDRDTSGLSTPAWSRTAVPADLDKNGFMDLVVVNIGAAPNIYMNGCDPDAHWVGVTLANRPQPIGARITVKAGGSVFIREFGSGSEGLGSGGPTSLAIGIGELETIDSLRVQWLTGEVFEAESVDVDRYYSIGRL